MKQIAASILICAMVLCLSSSVAQTTNPTEELLRLVKAVETQQAQISANQGKIETKLVEIGENVRVARIFASRSQ